MNFWNIGKNGNKKLYIYYKYAHKKSVLDLSCKTQGGILISGFKRYDDDFKQALVNFYQTRKIITTSKYG